MLGPALSYLLACSKWTGNDWCAERLPRNEWCDGCAAREEELPAMLTDLRDRLRLLAPMVCEGCGCAPKFLEYERCSDCMEADCYGVVEPYEHVGACLSVGMRALCGRKLLEGC